jgi:hypothetical protein
MLLLLLLLLQLWVMLLLLLQLWGLLLHLRWSDTCEGVERCGDSWHLSC